jgi:hypothetical protein
LFFLFSLGLVKVVCSFYFLNLFLVAERHTKNKFLSSVVRVSVCVCAMRFLQVALKNKLTNSKTQNVSLNKNEANIQIKKY